MVKLFKRIFRRIRRETFAKIYKNSIPDVGYMTENTESRLALIGLGNQGAKLLQYLCLMNYQVVCICDVSKRKANRLKKKFPLVTVVKQLEDLSEFEIDVCIIATLAPGRVSLIKRLNQVGIKKFLVEKPITNNMADSYLLSEYVKDENIHIEIYHPFLFSQDAKHFKNEIGKLDKGSFIGAKIYFKDKGLGNIGSHALSSFSYLTDIEIMEVLSSKLFENRSRGSMSDPNGLITFGTDNKGKIFVDNTDNLQRLRFFIEYEKVVINFYDNEKMVVLFKDHENKDLLFLATNSVNTHSGRYRALDEAISCLKDNTSHSLEYALAAVELVLASHASFRKSKSVTLPLCRDTEVFYNFS